ncbi:MAG: hypothetical protein HOW73_45965 [Polyangiaceae bacterium]|nr:hypothetical protein [Polyangiaceae bacterium]
MRLASALSRDGWGWLIGLGLVVAACGDDTGTGASGGDGAGNGGGTSQGGNGANGGSTSDGGSTADGGGGGMVTLPDGVDVTLAANGSNGTTRVNFAVPLQGGQLSDATLVRVFAGDTEIARGTRGLAPRGDGSFRSVQVQVDVDPAATGTLTVEIGEAGAAGDLPLVAVEDTLVDPSGEAGPRVWAMLPASWLSESGVTGPQIPEADVDGSLAAWADRCDYAAFDTDQFIAEGAADTRAVWLYDRGTAFYRGYARRGDLVPLASAYRESNMYRNLIVGSGTSARNGLPEGASEDVKYQYAQNLAIHYLLTGDDRFQTSAEDMALGMTELWPSPGYEGGADMWTERNAGFSLLAYVWAATVSDDQSEVLWAAADEAVEAYIELQETYPVGYDDPDARCFAHHGDAHDPDEGNPYFGCSPWMSAILADGLDAYARARGGAQADAARASLVKLGRILARDGRDESDVPYYWMGVGTDQDAPDEYLEHVGESAYVIALAWRLDGGSDAEMLDAANVLVDKFAAEGEVGQLRSFNWQCRSAVMTPWLLND